MDNVLVYNPALDSIATTPVSNATGTSVARPGATIPLGADDRSGLGTPVGTGIRSGVTEMLGVTIRPGVINVAAKEASMQRNATEPSGSKWKWYHWAIAIVLLAAVAYGGFLIYKKYK